MMRRLGLSNLSMREGGRVVRRACRGPVPDDPEERARMSAVVSEVLETRRRTARWAVLFFASLAALQAVLLVLDPSVHTALNVIGPVFLAALQFPALRTLVRRMAALEPTRE